MDQLPGLNMGLAAMCVILIGLSFVLFQRRDIMQQA